MVPHHSENSLNARFECADDVVRERARHLNLKERGNVDEETEQASGENHSEVRAVCELIRLEHGRHLAEQHKADRHEESGVDVVVDHEQPSVVTDSRQNLFHIDSVECHKAR